MLFAKAAWRVTRPRMVQFLGEPIEWVDTARYLGVTLDSRVTWRPHIVHVRKKAFQRLGVLGSVLNRRSGLSIRNGVLLYKQLIRPMMDYACLIWRCTARSYVKQLQALQSKCLRIATGAAWYTSSRQMQEDLGVPFFEEDTRALTESYDSKLAGMGNPLVRQLGTHLRWTRANASRRIHRLRNWPTSRRRMQYGGKSTSRRARYWLAGRISVTLTEVLLWFSSVVM
jgi:hypothetical protein